MRLANKLSALMLSLHLLSLVGQSQEEARPREADSTRLTMAASAKTHSADGAVVLKWSINNTSDETVSLLDINVFLAHKFIVKGQNGQPVLLSENGKQASTEAYFGSHRRVAVLGPGEKLTKELQISDFYDMRATGAYTIVIERRVPLPNGEGSEIIRSNVVRVRIRG